jgi:hypothetical protein
VRAAGLDRRPERGAGRQEVLLPDELVERPRAHTRGERSVERRRLRSRLLRLLGLEQLIHGVEYRAHNGASPADR